MKFRTTSRTFDRETLVARIGMTPLNDMHDLPVYGTDQRVKCRNMRGPWQEVELRVHALDEIDHPEFWKFLEEAVAGFQRFTEKKELKPEDVMPWKVLGQKWHFSRKGFPLGKRPNWPTELLEDVYELLRDASPKGEFLWSNQQVVHLMVTAGREPWATLHTKRASALELSLTGPKDHVTLGRIAHLGSDREVVSKNDDLDVVKIRFDARENLEHADPRYGTLADFLTEHVASFHTAAVTEGDRA